VVFLAGDLAYKLKRAVRFDYLDFSTSERRRAFCEAELRLNRRTAPALYRRVLPVTREADGSLALGGSGAAVDWLLEMNRFPQDALFDRLAEAGRLDLDLMPELAEAIASFHAAAERRFDHGGSAGMRWVVDGNAAGFAEFGPGALDASRCARVTDAASREIERLAELLDARRASGRVRHCHGDLHLGNIVLVDGRPTLFDGVEFNDEIACIDVLYDLAFLLMDLWHRRLPRHANAIWNRYLLDTEDLSGVALMPLFLSCRAAVRAKTGATAATLQADANRRHPLETLAGEYLAMAAQVLAPTPPSLVAIGGLSGSGKSTLALALAHMVGAAAPGAVVLRSDEIRKRLSGVAPLARLGPEGYTASVSERVYATLAERAEILLRAGHSVIVDAVYGRPAERRRIAGIAESLQVPFEGLWLEAPEPVLIARAAARRHDPSDADADVIRAQGRQDTGAVTWTHIDTSGPVDEVVRAASACLRLDLPGSSGPGS
jgi:aminoglycoside phosphotransferase family enzyme/predicted kinase